MDSKIRRHLDHYRAIAPKRVRGGMNVGRFEPSRIFSGTAGPAAGGNIAEVCEFRFQNEDSRVKLGVDMITLTEKAAAELGSLLASRATSPRSGLRLAVRRGGCAGWQYEMQVAEPEEGDVVVEAGDARVIVAADSIGHLQGCEIDFSSDLTDAGFKVHNPNASRSCGCGTSFETADEPPGAHAVPDGEACGNP